MDTSGVELDFFTMQKGSNGPHSSSKPPIFERRRSFRDIQSVISKMNPEVVKSVIADGCSRHTHPYNSVPCKLSVCDPTLRLRLTNESYDHQKDIAKTAPFTIFYNGMVAVFDVSPHKAQDILKIAMETNSKSTEYHENLCKSLDGDLPITRKTSLQSFLKKRKRG